jgi:hypothetical protein
MVKRRRFEQPQSIKERWLAAFAKKMREKASLLPPGTEQKEFESEPSRYGRLMGKFAGVAVIDVRQEQPAILLAQNNGFDSSLLAVTRSLVILNRRRRP